MEMRAGSTQGQGCCPSVGSGRRPHAGKDGELLPVAALAVGSPVYSASQHRVSPQRGVSQGTLTDGVARIAGRACPGALGGLRRKGGRGGEGGAYRGRGAMTTEERMAPEGRRAGRGAGPALNSSACSSGRKRDSPVAVEKPGRGIAPWHIEGLFKKITMPISKEESALGCPRGDGHQCVTSHMPHGLRFCPSLSRE